MARDEALLRLVGAGPSPPTLRLYGWTLPTVSLGYFQRYADYAALPPPAGALPVVRRQTGGGAILHDRELTYSIALPIAHGLVRPDSKRLYEVIHDALIATLRQAGIEAYRGCETDGSTATRGPFLCFARRHPLDVLVGADKLAGSAQRRSRAAVLQHGSIVFDRRFAQQPSAALGGLWPLDTDAFVVRWLEALSTAAEALLEPGEWDEAERALTTRLVRKYAGDEWTRRC